MKSRIRWRLLAGRGDLAGLSGLALVAAADLVLLLEIIVLRRQDPGLEAPLRFAQSLLLMTAAGIGIVAAVAFLRQRRVSGSRPDSAGSSAARRKAFYWSLFPTILLAGAVWMLWNYRIDGVLTWPDTEDYAQVASLSLLSPAFWAGGNPPGLPLVFKLFGLNWDEFGGPRYAEITGRITQFQAMVAFLAVGCLACSVAIVLRHKWLRPAAVLAIFALGLSIDVAQWNKMLLSESLSSSLFFVLLAGAILIVHWWDEPVGPRRILPLVLSVGLCLAAALYAFTRDVNAYFLLFAGLALLPVAIVAIVRRRKGRWVLAAVVAVILAAALVSVTVRRSRWSYPFINLVYDRILPDPAAVDFFVRRQFPIEVIDEIDPVSRRELHVAYRSDPRAEALRSWFAESARAVHLEFLMSRPLDTLSAPLPELARLVSPDLSWYRVREHPEPQWLPVASAIAYPKPSGILLLGFALILGATAVMIRSGLGRPIWAVPLLVLAILYPLLLVIWHGDSAAIPRHSLPVGVGLRVSLWMLAFFVVDAFLDRRGSSAVETRRPTEFASPSMVEPPDFSRRSDAA